ncbi:MAG: transferase, partial [Thiomonas sp.]|nr:transferase [Thiomonas sp.]
TRMMMGFLLFMAEPQNVTMIGLGGGSLAKFCYRHLPQTRILAVEINPHVIALRDEFHVPSDDDRFSVVRADGAQYVRTSTSPCDILMVDGYDSEGLSPRLCSQRFYDDGSALLRPGGIMVVNLQYSHDHYAIHLDRIRRSFGDSVLVVDDREGCNSIVFARKGLGFEQVRLGAVRRPRNLDGAAADALLAAFAQVTAALKQQRG